MNMQLEIQNKQERIPENGVYQRNGKWFMRYDSKSDGAEIPPDVARIIHRALKIERHFDRFPNGIVETPRDNVNCHTAAFRVLGLIDDARIGSTIYKLPSQEQKSFGKFDSTRDLHAHLNELRKAKHNFKLFSDKKFRRFDALEDLTTYLQNILGGGVGLIQVIDAQDQVPNFLNHSFIAAVDSLRRIVCFQKRDFKEPFQVVPLEKIYNFATLSRGKWAAAPIDSVRNSKEARYMQWVINK